MNKKPINRLKVLRTVLAVLFFTPVLLFFIDFADVLPDTVSKFLHLQIVPAILWGSGILVLIYLLLTFLFGRVYCSMICPAGVLQDIFNRLACIGKKKKNGSMRFRYRKPSNWLRYLILSITALLAIFGCMEALLLLDPYSNFGRIAANLFRPAIMWINNLFSSFLSARGNYLLHTVTIDIAFAALVSAVVALVVFAVMVYFRGRLFCNTLCPVGALLSLVSRYSLFRFTIDKDACNNCKICERSCKAEAILAQREGLQEAESKMEQQTVDMANCVSCFNCISSCSKNAIKFRFAPIAPFKKKKTEKEETQQHTYSHSRRSFIATSATLAGSAPLLALAQHSEGSSQKSSPITPPGAMSLERFKKNCTGCHICVVHCPSRVLKPAGFKFGLSYLLKPYMSYNNSFCNYACTVCSEVCPTHAIQPITVEQKKVTQIGIANFYVERCVVKTDGTDCGACSEH